MAVPSVDGTGQPAAPVFLREPLTVAVLTYIAPLFYLYWWCWQFFRFARNEGFAHRRSYLAMFIPLFNYISLYQLFTDLKRRLSAEQNVAFSAGRPILILALANVAGFFVVGLGGIPSIALLMVTFFAPAMLTYSAQRAMNRYLQGRYPQQLPRSTGLGEVAVVVLGVTLLGLDVLGASRGTTAEQQSVMAPDSPVVSTPSQTPSAPAAPFPASGDGFTIVSEVGDFVGQGDVFTYSSQDARMTINPGGTGSPGIDLEVSHLTDQWDIVIAPAAGHILQVGSYNNVVTNAGYPDALAPSLSVSGLGHGCNAVFGSFTVNALARDSAGQIVMIDVTFEQHCERPDAPLLTGRIRYVAPLWAPTG